METESRHTPPRSSRAWKDKRQQGLGKFVLLLWDAIGYTVFIGEGVGVRGERFAEGGDN